MSCVQINTRVADNAGSCSLLFHSVIRNEKCVVFVANVVKSWFKYYANLSSSFKMKRHKEQTKGLHMG